MFYTSFIPHISRGWKSSCSRFWPIWFHVRVLFLAYVLTAFSLHSHMAFPWCICTEDKWESALCCLFLWNQGSVFITSFNYFLRSPISSTITLGIMVSIYVCLGGHKYSAHNNDWCQFSMILHKITMSVFLRDHLPYCLWRSKMLGGELAYEKDHMISKLGWLLGNNQQETKVLSLQVCKELSCPESHELESKSFPRQATY